MNSSLGIKIAAAAGVALVLAIVLYARSGRQPPQDTELAATSGSAATNRPATTNGKPGPRNQIEERLQKLETAHGRTGRRQKGAMDGGAPGRDQAHPGTGINANRVPPPRQGAQPAAQPDESSDSEDEDEVDVDPDDLPALKNIAVRDRDPEKRLAAVTMLGTSEDSSVIPTLAQALSDEDDEVRLAAIQALSDFTGDAPIDLLSRVVVDDPSADNRYEALETLSDIGGPRAVSAIQKALNDADEDVRALAEGLLDNEDTFQEKESTDDTDDADEETMPAATPGK